MVVEDFKIGYLYIETNKTPGDPSYYRLYVEYVGDGKFKDISFIDNSNGYTLANSEWFVGDILDLGNIFEEFGPKEKHPDLYI